MESWKISCFDDKWVGTDSLRTPKRKNGSDGTRVMVSELIEEGTTAWDMEKN